MTVAPSVWTPERVAELRAFAAKKFTASAVGAKMGGLSKSAIIGAAHRFKINFSGNQAWNEERLVELRRLVEEKLSATEIAVKMDVKRGAVLGAARRNKIVMAFKPGSHGGYLGVRAAKGPPKPSLKVVRRVFSVSATGALPKPEYEQPAERQVDVTPLNLTFDQLDWGSCRWPYGDAPTMTFCGHPKLKTSSYCLHHFHLSRNATPRMTPDEMALHKQRYRRRPAMMEAAE